MATYITKARLLEVLTNHIGADKGIKGETLVIKIIGGEITVHDIPRYERQVRTLVEELRREGHHICATPETGYFIAATDDELDITCKFLYERAMTTLSQIAAMKRVSMPDLRGQLRLPT